MGAGLWVMFLIFYRQLDKPNGRKEGLIQTSIGVQWGIFIAFLLWALLAYAGYRIRASHVPEPLVDDVATPAGADGFRARGRRTLRRTLRTRRTPSSRAARARRQMTRSTASSPSTSPPSTARRRAAEGSVPGQLCRAAPSTRPRAPRAPRARPRSASQVTSSAARLLRRLSTVAAPLSTTSTHGWASTAASASASGVVPRSRAAASSGPRCARAVSRPLATASLTITPSPASWASAARRRPSAPAGSRSPARRRSRPTRERALDRLGLVGPGDATGRSRARRAQRGELAEHGGVIEHAAVERGRVDLVELEVAAEVRAGLGELAAQVLGASGP